jgi:crotonobetainyl-CoA:carnitine CoA-transferase CaiB-like acyl-CoA transferase
VFGRPLMVSVDHALCGEEQLLTHGWSIDGSSVLPRASAPLIGADTDAILRDRLGLEDQRIRALRAQRVLS